MTRSGHPALPAGCPSDKVTMSRDWSPRTSGSMAVQLLLPDVQAFLETYTKAFLSVDGAEIAVLYHVPCVTVRADGSVHCLQSREELQSFFQNVVDKYHQEGCRGWG